MKKVIFTLFLIINVFIPVCCYATVLDEVPPYVEIVGINDDDYIISKTIKSDEIVVELEEKISGLKYSWTFDKSEIKSIITLDFSIDFQSTKKEEIDNIAGDMNKVYLSFAHHGDLPSDAKIKVDVSDRFKDGTKLYLYYYNEDMKQMEFMDNNIKVVDGYAEFEIDHCSEYILTGAIVNDATNNPQSLSYVIIALGLLVLVLMAYTMFRR